jgi:nucleotide-binding universal stress UspA family protein
VKEIEMNTMHLSPMSRPQSILVATDLNDLDFLLPVAVDQARMTGAMIWLLHVVPPEVYAPIEGEAYPFVEKEEACRAAEAALATAKMELDEKNVACAYEVRRWYPVDDVKACIREHGIDRLIVGTSSRGKLGKLLVGSVAEELIRSLDIPVCTVGPHYKPPAPIQPRRILLALSLRHQPEQALRFAIDLADGLPAELTVLHVSEQDLGDEGLAAGAMTKIQGLLQGIGSVSVKPHIRIRCGEAVEEIIAECTAQNPELLVMGAISASPLSAKFRTGVAYRVIGEAPCPTFTLRSGAKTKPGGNDREFARVEIASTSLA